MLYSIKCYAKIGIFFFLMAIFVIFVGKDEFDMQFEEIKERLLRMDMQSYPVEEVRFLLREVGPSGFMVASLEVGQRIVRARVGTNVMKATDLSYRHSPELNPHYWRASTPDMRMFYGCLVADETSAFPSEYVSAVECSRLLSEACVDGDELVTFGIWKVVRPISVIEVIHPNYFSHAEENPLLKQAKFQYESLLASCPKHLREELDQRAEFFSYVFSRPNPSKRDYEYLISALFSEMSVKKGYDGVLYPSVATDGMVGLNVALTDRVADKCVCLDSVSRYKIHRMEDGSVSMEYKDDGYLMPNGMIRYGV